MSKTSIIIVLIYSVYFNLYSQNSRKNNIPSDTTKYHIVFPTREKEQKLKKEFQIYNPIIDLQTHQQVIMNDEQLKFYLHLIDTAKTLTNFEIINYRKVNLKSGVSWELNGKFPQKPDNFYFKRLTKNGRNYQSVINRLKYLDFFYYWDKNNAIPYDMIENIICYRSISINGRKQFEYSFNFIINEEQTLKRIYSKVEFYNDVY